MQFKHAGAYFFVGRLVVHSFLLTDYGSFACGPYRSLKRSAANDEIGRAVQAALDSSHVADEMPNAKDAQKEFFAGLGVKSNAALQRSSLYVSIQQSTDLELHPTHNGGTAGDAKGFQPVAGVEAIRIPPDAAPADIAAGLMNALAQCTTVYARP
jgi:hypothetical protein